MSNKTTITTDGTKNQILTKKAQNTVTNNTQITGDQYQLGTLFKSQAPIIPVHLFYPEAQFPESWPYGELKPSMQLRLERGDNLRLQRKWISMDKPETYVLEVTQNDEQINQPYITAILLRMQLLGEILGIKRELAAFLKYTHNETKNLDEKGNKDWQSKVTKELVGEQKAQRLLYQLENLIAPRLIWIKSSGLLFFITLLTILLFTSFGWLFHTNWLNFSGWGTVTVMLMVMLAVLFFLVAFNFQTLEDRWQMHLHEETHERLSNMHVRLTQFNLNVQANNTTTALNDMGYTLPPEGYIRHIDEVMQTKEAVNSLESTIKARIKAVNDGVHHIREAQLKSRKVTLAAGSAIFTGFFAHEVGESVLHHAHLKSWADPMTFLVWMKYGETKTSTPIKLGQSTKDTPIELGLSPKELQKCNEIGDCTQQTMKYGETKTSTPIKLGLSSEELQKCNKIGDCTQQTLLHANPQQYEFYKENFMEHELDGSAIVLFITLIFTAVVAILALRKPPDEGNNEGHEHH